MDSNSRGSIATVLMKFATLADRYCLTLNFRLRRLQSLCDSVRLKANNLTDGLHMKKFLAKLTLPAFLAISGMAWASNWYVDPLAAGSNSGASWTNAWPSFSTINWGSINPGDTIYLSGGVTSQQYNAQLTVSKSGSSGGRITISVGQDAGHNGTVIIDGGAIGGSRDGINFRNYNYLNFEGNYGGKRHLLIQNTNGCISNYGNNGGSASGGHHVHIEYVECSGTYEGLIVTHGAGDGGWRSITITSTMYRTMKAFG